MSNQTTTYKKVLTLSINGQPKQVTIKNVRTQGTAMSFDSLQIHSLFSLTDQQVIDIRDRFMAKLVAQQNANYVHQLAPCVHYSLIGSFTAARNRGRVNLLKQNLLQQGILAIQYGYDEMGELINNFDLFERLYGKKCQHVPA